MYFFLVILYEIVYIGSAMLSTSLSMGSWLTVWNVTLYFCILFWWLHRNKKVTQLGIKMIGWKEWKDCCFGMPLLALPIYNLWISQAYEFEITTFLIIMYSVLAEEVFFRSFLFEYLSRWGKGMRIIGSSILFAVVHFVNLLSGNEMCYVGMQVLCAFVAGICFAFIRIRSGSIMICVVWHFFINLTAGDSSIMRNQGLWLCILVYVLYGLWLWKKNDNSGQSSPFVDNDEEA